MVLIRLRGSMITSDVVYISHPANAVLLGFSLALVPAFIFWVRRQERLQKPALVPNSIWKNQPFTTACLMVLLSFAVMQSMELFVSLLYVSIPGPRSLHTTLIFVQFSEHSASFRFGVLHQIPSQYSRCHCA